MSDPQSYTIGWICALSTELTALQAFFDERHAKLAASSHNDTNDYELGRIGMHNIVVAVLPKSQYGLVNAATVAKDNPANAVLRDDIVAQEGVLCFAILEKDADVNAQGGHYGNALQAASSEGRLDIVRLLLENDADVNAPGGEYGNALQAASDGGHLDIVRLLLERNADVNAQGGFYENALQAALSEGHIDIVQLLNESGAVNVETVHR